MIMIIIIMILIVIIVQCTYQCYSGRVDPGNSWAFAQ